MSAIEKEIELRELVPRARSSTPAPSNAPRLRRVLVTTDLVLFAIAWAVTVAIVDSSLLSRPATVGRLALVVAAGMAAMAVQPLYTTNDTARRGRASWHVCCATAVSGAAAFLVVPWPAESALAAALLGAALAAAGVNGGRVCFEQWLASCRARGLFVRPILLVGNRQESRTFMRLLERNPEFGYRVVAIVGPEPEAETEDVPWLGPAASARSAVAATEATGAIVLVNGISSVELGLVVRDLVASGAYVHLSNGLLGLGCRRLQPVPLGHEPFMYVRPPSLSRLELAAKRLIDITVALLLLVLTAPALVLAAIAIKVSDRGPVFFRQVRVGQDGRRIVVHKLRTMVVDAERLLDDVRHLNEREGPLFKMTNDPRVTKVGGFLRSSSIDELPQLFDVLRGDMSVVGPRPALPTEAATFGDDLQIRQLVRPGVTGLWQIEARDKPEFDSYSQLDRFYVENWSLGLDLSILVSTVPVVLTRALNTVRPRHDDGVLVEAVEPAIDLRRSLVAVTTDD